MPPGVTGVVISQTGISIRQIMGLGFASLFLSLILTPVIRELFRAFGFVDHPTLGRKIHTKPIPRAGGLTIALSYVLAFFLVQRGMGIMNSQLALVWKVLPSACIILGVGIIDDLRGLKHWQKLIGQTVAASLACANGIVVMDVVGMHAHSWWTAPATVLWLLACTNAFNLVDGMDGLAAGMGLMASLTVFVAALMQNNMALAMGTIALAGCLLGFLRYNFNPATTFLGDSGSLLIGFVLGCYGIIWTQKSATILAMTAPMMAFSIPLVDVGLAIVRRFLRTQPIFSADRGHIHHRLLDRGMSPRKVALLFYGLSSIVAVFSLLQNFSHSNRIASVVVLVFCAVSWMGIQYLEYAEFALAGRILFGGDLQRTVKAQIDLEAFSHQLRDLQEPEDCYRLLAETATRFGFTLTQTQIAGERFIGATGDASATWSVRVRGVSGDFAELSRTADSPLTAAAAGPFLDAVRSGLAAKNVPIVRRKPISFAAGMR
jgi:UDP-GlcNAc:undecaprenyl-phosphate/decaprenyl-phosphate GlcNAc-1-phosphate transferase